MVRKLSPLKTLSEISTSEETVEALVVEIPIKLASRVLSILKPILPPATNSSTLPHLRRLVTNQHLPIHLRPSGKDAAQDIQTIFLLLPPPLPKAQEDIAALLKPHIQDAAHLPTILSTRIPLHPPINAEQAATWSSDHWPCTYNPASQTIQNAPPLHSLRRMQAELETDHLEDYMQLAERVALDCKGLKIGRAVGTVIVDPDRQEVVVVAGDARLWTASIEHRCSQYWGTSDGRPEHHALMRAIAMVAEKELERRKRGEDAQPRPPVPVNGLGGRPLMDIEKFYCTDSATEDGRGPSTDDATLLPKKQSSSRPDTYLCNGLDVYLTHEPCVCCAMAMIHSRFRACIFSKRMPGTGGLCAETADGGLGYGLFWRRELNWRVMTFKYRAACTPEYPGKEDKTHRAETEMFHA